MHRRGRIAARSFVSTLAGTVVAVGAQIALTPLALELSTHAEDAASGSVGAVSGGFDELVIFPVLGLIVWAVVMLPLLLVLDRKPMMGRRSARLAVGVVLGSVIWLVCLVIVWPRRPPNLGFAVLVWSIPTAMMTVAMAIYRPPPDL